MKKIIFCLWLMAMAFVGHAADHFINVGALHVRYTVSGKGDALVLIHAGYQDLQMWEPQENFFKKYYKVVLIDMPGHGLTTGIDTNLLVKDVIKAVLDTLHIQKTIIAGLSMGAACATDFVIGYPERVRGLIVVSSGLSGWPLVMKMDTMSRALLLRMDSIRETGDHAAMAEGFMATWCVGPYRKAAEVDARVRTYVYETTLRNHTPDNGWPRFDTNYASKRIKDIKCPVLIIRGDKDIPFVMQTTDFYKHELPGATLVTFTNVAHMLNMEKPEEFNKTVYAWLKDLGAVRTAER